MSDDPQWKAVIEDEIELESGRKISLKILDSYIENVDNRIDLLIDRVRVLEKLNLSNVTPFTSRIPKVKGLSFWEVFPALKEGGSIRRLEWGCYSLNKNTPDNILDTDDILANDWIVVDE